ncbi:MAG: RluA family pseudouridine synthase [bacterium]|nr:RluA family pseudouridine synthase [bacterium]
MNNLKILYEDNHIIVVVKPPNVLSQSDNTNDIDMLTIIKKYIKEKYEKPGNVYLGLVHRLDRPVGGIMVYAKTSKSASRLSEQIRNRTFKKEYIAVVHGLLKNKKGSLENYILKRSDNTSVICDSKKGKIAKLNYKVINQDLKNNLSLVSIELLTGRHHQIRIQFSNIGHPLFGDQRYGYQDKKQIALFSNKIKFIHPTKKEKMEFEYYPKEQENEVWKMIKNVK